jgi:hypothetical protein
MTAPKPPPEEKWQEKDTSNMTEEEIAAIDAGSVRRQRSKLAAQLGPPDALEVYLDDGDDAATDKDG